MANSEQPTAIAATVPPVKFAWLFPLAAILLPVGLSLCTVATTWRREGEPSVIKSLFVSVEGVFGALLTLLGAFGIWRGVWALPLIAGASPEETCERHYNRCLVGVGYALFVCAVFCCALVGGFLYSKNLPVSAAAFEDSILKDPGGLARLVALSSAVAVLGALFFVANSLRQKREARVELFSSRKFWGGLWYRLGEAILFSLVAFWLIWSFAPPKTPMAGAPTGAATPAELATANPETETDLPTSGPVTTNPAAFGRPLLGYSTLPVMSLLMGMFVTSGEKLIFGIARGLFRAVGAFFGSSEDRESEREVRNVSEEG